jgi:hypothetical protein
MHTENMMVHIIPRNDTGRPENNSDSVYYPWDAGIKYMQVTGGK